MRNAPDYNIIQYLMQIKEIEKMLADGIITRTSPCKKYPLSGETSEYLYYVEDEPFYISPSFYAIKLNDKISTAKPKILMFSAPGATGKSSLAKYLAYKHNAIYWDLAKLKLGTNSFAGSILNAIGVANYSGFMADLCKSNAMLIIDAFDEAEVISGRKMLGSFIQDIDSSLADCVDASIIFLARTETAQFIASLCLENSISLLHYEIGFFEETQAKCFIEKLIEKRGRQISPAITDCIDTYYSFIKNSITKDEAKSFLGYAPVLEAIAEQVRQTQNTSRLISLIDSQTDSSSIIMKIMDDLLAREQEKLSESFKKKCIELHSDFSNWEMIYSPQEQLTRLVYYTLFHDTSYSNYPIDILPPQLVDEYEQVLQTFLPQHPFIRTDFSGGKSDRSHFDFTGPAFRDYSLAKIILSNSQSELAHIYFEESSSQYYFPSQIFFDCYANITNGKIFADHISYMYDSYRAKATAREISYLQCSEIPEGDLANGIAIFGMSDAKNTTRDETVLQLLINNGELFFEQASHISIDVPSYNVRIGRKGCESQVDCSNIVCKQLIFDASNVTFDVFPPDKCILVSEQDIVAQSTTFDVSRANDFKVSAPNIKTLYKLIPFSYDFSSTSSLDIMKFTYATRCIMIEFRTHKKDTLAKDAERIDNVVVGNSPLKQKILSYLKDRGIIYLSFPLYKVDIAKMRERSISYSALTQMNYSQMQEAFDDFKAWNQAELS